MLDPKDIHVNVNVPESLMRKLRAINGAAPEIEKTTLKAVLTVHENVPPYPDPPPNSTYERTGTLGRSVTTLMGGISPEALSRVEPINKGFIGFIGTRLKYAPKVIGEDQTALHKKTGWYVLSDMLTAQKARIIGLYEDLLRRLTGGGE